MPGHDSPNRADWNSRSCGNRIAPIFNLTTQKAEMAPRVSIVMPCLNGEQTVLRSIRSVLEQTMTDFELIFVDNGSTDQTLRMVGDLQDPRLCILRQPERGVSRARNMGISVANSPLMAFLDSDDTWDVRFLEKMCASMTSNPDCVLAYCGWQNFGAQGGRGEPFIPPDYETPSKVDSLLRACRWPIHGCMVRTAVVAELGGFDTSLVIGEDYLLWMEIASRGRIVRNPEVLAYYHQHDGIQATRNQVTAVMDTFRAKMIFLGRHPDVVESLGKDRIAELTWGEFINHANDLYWNSNIDAAHPLFRFALRNLRGSFKEKLRMLPSLLPLPAHRVVARLLS
jgi:glycosyltransferase involved in cell wall biosynthesis